MVTATVPVQQPVARPFIKWAGGKTQLLAALREHVPVRFGRYFEPFVGGGALFFDLHARGRLLGGATLGDANPYLVNAYRVVRDRVDELIDELRTEYVPAYRDGGERFYYAVRSNLHALDNKIERAAAFIFLNKTCFNGLWRVNRAGRCNVPWGKYKNPTICDANNLIACSRALRGAARRADDVELRSEDFRVIEQSVGPGDFVYFDPPYVPVSPTSSFTAYAKDPFGLAEQTELRDLADRLRLRGVHVLLSNADTAVVRELYAGFGLCRIEAARAVNSKGDRRGAVGELLIW